jgi:predicted HTH domain antitoxin
VYPEEVDTVRVDLPADLAREAGLGETDPSRDAARLLALSLYREEAVSLGRAAELCGMSVEHFLEYAGNHGAVTHYGPDELAEDRATLERLGL